MCVCMRGCSCDDVRATASHPLVDVGDLQGDGNERTQHHLQRGTHHETFSAMTIQQGVFSHAGGKVRTLEDNKSVSFTIRMLSHL